jgi:hypothetical protein
MAGLIDLIENYHMGQYRVTAVEFDVNEDRIVFHMESPKDGLPGIRAFVRYFEKEGIDEPISLCRPAIAGIKITATAQKTVEDVLKFVAQSIRRRVTKIGG